MSKLLIFVLLASLSTWAQSGSSGGTVTVSGSPATNDCAKFVSATVITTAGAACGAGGGGGTVTSVGWTGGLISVGTPTSTPAFTVAGTSGGIPYFDTTASWATSALLTNHAIVLGGGAGASPTVLGSLGTTTTVLHGAAAGAPTFAQVTSSDIDSSVAPTASPTFSGTPSLPTGTTGVTQTALDATTKLSTTLYVDQRPSTILFWACTGTATSNTTIQPLYANACTNTSGVNTLVPVAGNLKNFIAKCGTGGSAAGSGVFTVNKGGVGTTITCTMGTGTSCSDSTHTVAFAAGDAIETSFTTQGSETLASCRMSVEVYQ